MPGKLPNRGRSVKPQRRRGDVAQPAGKPPARQDRPAPAAEREGDGTVAVDQQPATDRDRQPGGEDPASSGS